METIAEYIEREALLEDIQAAVENGGMGGMVAGSLKRYITRVPAADVSPVRHGKWGSYEPYLDGYRCSCCKLVHRTCTSYCSNCGAKMDECDGNSTMA